MAKRQTKQSEQELLEQRFVEEYLVDFDQYLAAIRAGIPRLQAKKKATLLMSTTTVQLEIVKRVDAMQVDQIATPQRILMGLMREAGRSTFGSDRIGALRTVHEIIKDMRKSAKEDASEAEQKKRDGKKGGVMLVPGAASLSDWESAAKVAQAALKAAVKE